MDNNPNAEDPSFLYPQENNNNNGVFMDDYSQIQNDEVPSTIKYVQPSTFTVYTSETIYINKIIGEKDYPYPNIENNEEKRDIPFIEILDEKNFIINKEGPPPESGRTNGRPIGDYLKKIKEVSESQFDTCRKCLKYQNKYFCKSCDRNLCEDCSKNCRNESHELINLKEEKQGDILIARQDVTRLIDKKFKEEEKKTESNSKAKKIYSLDKLIIKENQGIIKESIENYTRRNDFLLIARIVLRDYTNYYHFQNILSCYQYLAGRFLHTLDKNCLKIIYEVNKENKGNKEIQIFHPNFVEKNKDKLKILVNNELTEFNYKVTIDDDYLEVILIQESKTDYITDLSYMFCDCENLLGIKKHLDHALIDFRGVKNISHMFENCVKIESIDFGLFINLPLCDELKMDNLFRNCSALTSLYGFLEIDDANLRNNIFNGCKKLNNNYNNNIQISLNSNNNNDNLNINKINLPSSKGNNSNKESSYSEKEIKFIEYENQIKYLNEQVKSLKENQTKYEKIQKNEKIKKNLDNFLNNKDFTNAFEAAINLESIEQILRVIRDYYLKCHGKGTKFPEKILANIMSILSENLSSIEQFTFIIRFVFENIIKKNISFDTELNNRIYIAFLDLYKNDVYLEEFNIKKDDILKIVKFFENKKGK